MSLVTHLSRQHITAGQSELLLLHRELSLTEILGGMPLISETNDC